MSGGLTTCQVVLKGEVASAVVCFLGLNYITYNAGIRKADDDARYGLCAWNQEAKWDGESAHKGQISA